MTDALQFRGKVVAVFDELFGDQLRQVQPFVPTLGGVAAG